MRRLILHGAAMSDALFWLSFLSGGLFFSALLLGFFTSASSED